MVDYLKRTTQHCIPEDGALHNHCCENLKPYKVLFGKFLDSFVVTTSMKEDEKGGQGHTSASLLNQSAM
jgi:hypothetical protein